MNPEPLISVVIPSYNHGAFVAAAIDSVAAQDWPRVELIVVDDGSKDDSPAIIARRLAGLGVERTELVVQKNAGAHAAINRGLGLARGEYLQILNSDDLLGVGRLRRLMRELADVPDGLAFSDVRVIDQTGAVVSATHRMAAARDAAVRDAAGAPTVGYGLLQVNSAFTTSNFLFGRALWERVGGFTPEKLCHDWRFLLRCLPWTEPRWVREPLLDYRVHGTNTVNRVVALAPSEGAAALREYLATALRGPTANRLAPCPHWWPGYFHAFVRDRHSWFSRATIASHLPGLEIFSPSHP